MEHPFMYRASLPRAERSRREAPDEVLFDTDPAVTPMGTMVRGLGIAVLLSRCAQAGQRMRAVIPSFDRL